MNTINDTKNDNQVPQMRVRSNLSAGESADACLNNLNHWRDQAYKKCGFPKPPVILE